MSPVARLDSQSVVVVRINANESTRLKIIGKHVPIFLCYRCVLSSSTDRLDVIERSDRRPMCNAMLVHVDFGSVQMSSDQ
jgi:hypothetical protein